MNEPINIEKKYRIGALDQRVQFLAPTEAQGTSGEVSQTWGDYGTRWANVMPMGGDEVILGDMQLPYSRIRVVVRYDSSITEKFRMVWNSHTYNVTSIDVIPRNRFLMISAESYSLSGTDGVDYGNYYATNSLRIRQENSGTTQPNNVNAETILGISASAAGEGYVALVNWEQPSAYWQTLLSSDGTRWFTIDFNPISK